MVIEVSKKHFPQMAVGYSDPRVQVRRAASLINHSLPAQGAAPSLTGHPAGLVAERC